MILLHGNAILGANSGTGTTARTQYKIVGQGMAGLSLHGVSKISNGYHADSLLSFSFFWQLHRKTTVLAFQGQ
jgi:hypothetical protein